MEARSLRKVIESLKYLSSRKVIAVGFLLSISIAVSFDMALIIAGELIDEDASMLDMIQSWHFWVLIVALAVMIYSVYMISRYASRTEQDITMQRIDGTLDEIRDSIKELVKEIKLNRDERKKNVKTTKIE